MRLIDADNITGAKFHDLPYTHIIPRDVESESYMFGWNDAIDAIVEVEPTIDAVEVVRCKDCKYWKHTNGSFGRCCYEYWEENERFRTYIERFCEDYCSDGERGEADDETGSD